MTFFVYANEDGIFFPRQFETVMTVASDQLYNFKIEHFEITP